VRDVQIWRNVSAETFLAEIKPVARPALLKGLAARWPLVAAGHQSDAHLCAYLSRFDCGSTLPYFAVARDADGRVFYNSAMTGMNFSIKSATWPMLADIILRAQPSIDDRSVYAGSLPIERHFPGLAHENNINSFVPASDAIASLWIGGPSRIAAHFDIPENLACVVAGKRRFTLFPPHAIGDLHVGPYDFTPAGQPISLVDFSAPDFDRFPRFAEALKVAEGAELEAGDALYIPSLWWHHVESVSALGALVNYWWRDVPRYFGSPNYSLLHAALAIRELPEAQRRAWQAVFDHYVFQLDDSARFPESGLFGPLSPTTAAQIRGIIKQALT